MRMKRIKPKIRFLKRIYNIKGLNMEREAHKLCTSSCDDRATNIRKQLWLWARIWITKVEDGYTCEF